MSKGPESFPDGDKVERPEPQVAIDQLGKVSQIDWSTAAPGVDKKEILNTRIQLMKGSYGKKFGLMNGIIREIKVSGVKINFENYHDALVTILQKSELPVDLTDIDSVDAAIVAYTDKRKGR